MLNPRPTQTTGTDQAAKLLARAVDPADPTAGFIGYPGRRLGLPVQRGDVLLVDNGRGRSNPLIIDNRNGQFAAIAGNHRPRRLTGPDGLLLPGLAIIRDAAQSGNQPLPIPERPVLREGSYGPAVLEAQRLLNLVQQSLVTRGMSGLGQAPLAEDGRFGPATRAAVAAFQRLVFSGEPVQANEVIDQRLWAALLDWQNRVPGAADPAAPPSAPPQGTTPADPSGEQATDVTPDLIAQNLAAITDQVTTAHVGLQPNAVDFNTIAYANTPSKRTIFRQLAVARRGEAQAEARLAQLHATAAPANIASPAALVLQRRIAAAEAAVATTHGRTEQSADAIRRWLHDHGHAHNRALRALELQHRPAARALAAAQRRGGAPAITAAQQALAAIEAQQTAAGADVDRLIAAYVPLVQLTQNHHVLNVDGQAVRLHDNVIAYATIDARGLEGQADRDGGRAGVNARLDQAATGDHRRILAIISHHEGTFSNVNTWDRAIVTFGFIQWTFGEGGDGSLLGLLAEFKRREPQIFHDRLQRYGIDLTARAVELSRIDGTVLTGAAAAAAIQIDPKLTAVISRLGTEPAVQDIQIQHAIETKITAVRARRVPGHVIAVSAVVSSSFGTGVLTDRVVGGGAGAALATIRGALDHFLHSNPGADLLHEVWAARAEPEVIAALTAMDPDRAASYAALPHDRGSFAP